MVGDVLAPALSAPAPTHRLGAVALVVGGAFSQQFGAAVATLLFPRVGALGVVTLRLAISAVVLLAACRPAIRGRRRADWLVVCAFGVALAGMNLLFYQAISRIPLGAAVTLEVLGPLVLSVLASRGAARWLWAALALTGVVLLGRGGFGGLNPTGAAFALAAGALWAAYIPLSARTGARFARVEGLALAVSIGALLSLPLGLASAGTALFHPMTLVLGASVALLSSMLPYSLELLSLRRLPAATFAVLMSLMPAIAALAGCLVLGQAISLTEAVAIALVVSASIGAVSAQRTGTGQESGSSVASVGQ
jgi:inner membrane transporter RhtA